MCENVRNRPRFGAKVTRIDVKSYSALSQQELAQWDSIQCDEAAFHHPFFSYHFASAVAKARQDVKVAVLRSAGDIVGFFAFQGDENTPAEPIGGKISDYQGVVIRSGYSWDVTTLFSACQISSWSSRHLLASQREFEPWQRGHSRSLAIDLRRGAEQWTTDLRLRGSSFSSVLDRKARMLERCWGKLVFTELETSQAGLRTLMRCKSEQYVRTGSTDEFAIPWIADVVQSLHTLKESSCTGVLSTLTVEGQLLASHFGLRSSTIWHYWFPCYSPAFRRFSPGLLLLRLMVERAAEIGCQVFDLGAGDFDYKMRIANHETTLRIANFRRGFSPRGEIR